MKAKHAGYPPVQSASETERDRAYTNADKTDHLVMLMAEAKRAAGATPRQRAELAEYHERTRRGEWHR